MPFGVENGSLGDVEKNAMLRINVAPFTHAGEVSLFLLLIADHGAERRGIRIVVAGDAATDGVLHEGVEELDFVSVDSLRIVVFTGTHIERDLTECELAGSDDVQKRTGFDREQFFLCGIIFLHLDIKFAESKVIVRSESLAVVNEGLHVLVTVETFLLKDPGQLVFLRNNPADFLL